MASRISSAGSFMAGVIDTVAPVKEPFKVRIGTFEFRFRHFEDGDEWDAAKGQALTWAKTLKGKTCPVDLKGIRVRDQESVVTCYIMGLLCLGGIPLVRDEETGLWSPAKGADGQEVPLSPVPSGDWLLLAHDHPLGFEHVKSAFNDEITGNARIQAQEAIIEGKGD